MSISASTPNLALSKTSSSSKPSSIPNQTQSSPSVPPSGEFHHLFLELRACVANVCASSESCELFFSLYSKPAAQFVTEEFLVVIDDHGRPIRSTRKGEGGEAVAEIRAGGEGGEGGLTRVKALIVDLADQDVVDLVLVCRVVRCGALKMAEIGGGRSLTASPSSSPRPGTPSQSSAASSIITYSFRWTTRHRSRQTRACRFTCQSRKERSLAYTRISFMEGLRYIRDRTGTSSHNLCFSLDATTTLTRVSPLPLEKS
jgi:hypothetical protein